MAKIKNKKMSNKRRRRRQKRMILLGLIILVVILLVSCVAKIAGNKKEKEEPDVVTSEPAEKTEEEKKQEEIAQINALAKEAGASPGILDLIRKNEETIDFVRNFPEKHALPPAETIGQELVEGEIPHLLQWDEKWGYQSYGESTIAASGCGPTCLSMVVSALTGDETLTPYVMAELAKESGYMLDEGGTYAAFMQYGAEYYGLKVTESWENEDFVAEELRNGHPIICNLEPGKCFTDVGHFIVLTEYENGMVSVRDPFNIANTEKQWNYQDFKEQIIGMWSYAK